MAEEWDVRTRLVQADADSEEGAPLNTPLVLSTTFRAHPEGVGFSAEDLGEESPYFYARWSTPTVRTLERRRMLDCAARTGRASPETRGNGPWHRSSF